MEFETVIGLEVHAELLMNTKIFCGCTTQFGGQPNTHVCPVCMGLPGALPQFNKKAVDLAIKAGLALNCEITKDSRMDRKNYFYPDCPKDYQITQDEFPICHSGYIEIELEDESKKKIGIQRIHMEEDAGKLLHTKRGTLIDFNRAGAGLIEIVSDPDIRSPKEATLYLEKLRSILTAIGVSDGKMEEGSLRCDGNISIRPKGLKEYGIRTEIKNMNSFKALEKALEYEYIRQVKAVTSGEKLSQDTRRWDDSINETVIMRSKEAANDYRYFPEGDLVTLKIDDQWIEEVRKSIPELPHEKAKRFEKEFNLSKYDASVLTLTTAMADFFEEAAKLSKDAKSAANWLMGDISRLLNEKNLGVQTLKFTPKDLADLIHLINSGKISNAIGKKVIDEMYKEGKNPEKIVEEKGLIQNSDEGAILEVIKEVIAANKGPVEEYKGGKKQVMGFMVGMAMKASKGKANPQIVNKLMAEELEKL